MAQPQNVTGNITPPNKDFEVLKQHFPNCFDKSGNFDFEKFKAELEAKEVNFSKESYGMDWLGKSYARLLAVDPATTLLKEDKEWNAKPENKDSENLLIKGDNLEVLKHLSNAYYEKVKMIYIDPPYNTGSDGFVYEDDRKFTVNEFCQLAGVDQEHAKRVLSFVDSKSNSHSAWLTFMYPRLYIAKQLLKEDGVIFVSIDDNEVAQLRILMDEVFGEENFVAELIWQKKFAPSNDAKWFSDNHDHIIVFSRNKETWRPNLLERSEENISRYKNPDNDRRGVWVSGDMTAKTFSASTVYEITTPSGRIVMPPDGICWRFTKSKFEELVSDNRIWFGKNGNNVPRVKRFLSEVKAGITPLTIWLHNEVGHNQEAFQELRKLFDGSQYFDTPKPTKLIKQIVKMGSEKDSIIMDFFAGSGTTGDAVMQLNAEDGGNRKFILVQLPEKIDPKGSKLAYDFVKKEMGVEVPTIFEITKERLVRAAKKIAKEQAENKDLFTGEGKLDLGFKVFETQPIWEDYEFEEEKFDQTQTLFEAGKLTQTDLDMLLLTWKTYDNIPLTQSLTPYDLGGYTGHYANGRLYLVNKGFKTEHLKTLLEKIDADTAFSPTAIVVFGYHFESKSLREIAESVSGYNNKKQLDIDFITRY